MIKMVTTAAAVLVLASTSAFAGGFSYGSAGGNIGNWAYADAATYGTASVESSGSKKRPSKHSRRGGNNVNGGLAFTTSTANQYAARGRNWTKSGGQSSTTSGFIGTGSGSAHAASSVVAGGGVGAGIGFKIGGFR